MPLLTVFKPFFVSLNHPRSVTRHEQFVLQATVYNYLPQNLTVSVFLKPDPAFKFIKISKNGTENLIDENVEVNLQVGSNQQGVTYFPILASVAGALDLDVSAKSSMAADAVRGQVNVKLEGAPLTFNNPVYVTLNSSTSFVKSLNITFPTGVVPGSKRIRAAVTGDLLGSSLNSLSSLLTIPTGYGDTNLFMFAPNLYMAKYLNVTKQTRTSYYKEAIRGLEEGFQSLLTIKRTDGSFSRGGDGDRTGSVWLTALASRAVHEASVYINVDSTLMSMATSWLIERQNSDGSFKEFSKILDKKAQGSVPALTSLVMLSILENNDHTHEKTCRTTNLCYFRKSMLNATSRALEFLERMVEQDALNDPYTLAVVSYGLAKSGSTKANLVFRKLLALGVREGGFLYWRADSSDEEQLEHPSRWRPVHKQARSADVIITSYAVLTFVTLGRLEEAVPAVTWLTSQRNPLGGFVSTQDTVTGLQALAEFATQSLRPDTSVSVTVDDTMTRTTFTVNQDNSLTLQTRELFESPAKIVINAAGKGNALVEVATSFNIEEELLSQSFDVKVVVLDDEVNKLRMMVCTRLLSQRSAGLVVQEVGIPSGFQPDLTAVDNVAGLVKTEVKGNFLDVYLDEIGKSTLCYTLSMVRVAKVARSQKCYVKTYDYYETGNQATVFYEPQAIKEAGICDVCKGCFPYQICRLTVGDRNI
ncbi:CD109 antigen-like [Physella acuta]|uniref:CD109 antigen-like n=1 Tax=Physella acuta TaxID=109671 RepID=UPI0027DBA6D4|nr:CD109 antigen-like [Physella acuta]